MQQTYIPPKYRQPFYSPRQRRPLLTGTGILVVAAIACVLALIAMQIGGVIG
jgi:hypothetical protein